MDAPSASVRYFLRVYGSQRRAVNRPNLSHTFATFTEKQVGPNGSPQPRDLTISWLPRDGNINPLGPAEVGRNYGLGETFTWLDQADSGIRWQSPETEIKQALFDSAEARIKELDEGIIQYIMIDNPRTRPHNASNCIHAVSDVPVAWCSLGPAITGFRHGIEASWFVYNYLHPFFLTHPSIPQADLELFEKLHRANVEFQMKTVEHPLP